MTTEARTTSDPFDEPPGSALRSRRALRIAAAVAGGIVGLLLVVYVADVAIAGDSVPRGVHVAGVDIGAKSRDEAGQVLQRSLGARASAPIKATAAGVPLDVSPAAAGLAFD